jgi:3-oxoacyl-[acyl-carrier protein] reductase
MLSCDLRGKTALLTGATGQLGRVMAKTLADCGANMILVYYQNQAKAEELKQQIEETSGVKVYLHACDVTDYQSVMAMQQEIAKNFIEPDIIVDCAVIQYSWTTVLEQPIEDYESQFRSCVLHKVNMAKAFVPHMIKQHYGRVIGINTECAMQTFPTQSAYVAGKRGMDGVMRILAKEIGPHNITVNQVAPGWTISENDRINHTEVSESSDAAVPLRRRGTDQEIANVVAFLASDLASYITGAYIPVCGGNVMPRI